MWVGALGLVREWWPPAGAQSGLCAGVQSIICGWDQSSPWNQIKVKQPVVVNKRLSALIKVTAASFTAWSALSFSALCVQRGGQLCSLGIWAPSSRGGDLGGVCCVVLCCVSSVSPQTSRTFGNRIAIHPPPYSWHHFTSQGCLWSWTQAHIRATQRE